VQEILHAGRHLLELINEVLDLARIESGKFTVSMEPVPVMPLIEDCLTLIRPLAEARGLRIDAGGPDCGEHVLADRTRLKQVLLNLLSNAVKYNRDQGRVGIVCVPAGDRVQIRISDSGTGLSAEQQGRLFVAFERLGTDQHAIEGTGIGLALSKRLVELMDGEIGVESTPGVGSTFWVRLAAAEGQSGFAPEAGAPEAEARPAGHKQWDVLCIEDNPANLRLIEGILALRSDIRLLSASAPGLGLELAAAHRPVLILLDINLPDMDGYAVMQCLRENPVTRNIPVVAVSANAMPQDLERGTAAGFADYLTKPLDVHRLLRVVDDIVGRLVSDGKHEPRNGS
jgi:CheY-like chemotaxis protein/anti-sigma regulatory factor (Ser/Thr protein kinase)